MRSEREMIRIRRLHRDARGWGLWNALRSCRQSRCELRVL